MHKNDSPETAPKLTAPIELTDDQLDHVTGGKPADHTWPPTLASQGDFQWKSQGPYGQSTYLK
jgi:hypothetical protein